MAIMALNFVLLFQYMFGSCFGIDMLVVLLVKVFTILEVSVCMFGSFGTFEPISLVCDRGLS